MANSLDDFTDGDATYFVKVRRVLVQETEVSVRARSVEDALARGEAAARAPAYAGVWEDLLKTKGQPFADSARKRGDATWQRF